MDLAFGVPGVEVFPLELDMMEVREEGRLGFKVEGGVFELEDESTVEEDTAAGMSPFLAEWYSVEAVLLLLLRKLLLDRRRSSLKNGMFMVVEVMVMEERQRRQEIWSYQASEVIYRGGSILGRAGRERKGWQSE